MNICGVDEAGRGPVIGPLVIAAFSIEEERLREVASLGVKDSKKLNPKRRTEIYSELLKLSKNYFFKVLSPNYLNTEMKRHTLNEIELWAFIDSVIGLNVSLKRVICDSCDVNADRFSQSIKEGVCKIYPDCEVIAAHKAEDKYPIVAAASILAKVKRDEILKEIEDKVGTPIGSGYPSDPITISFLKDYYKINNSFPDYVRAEWKTLKNIKSFCNQTKLI
ncbi:MAG: Ribonuclease HII [Candidatus Methanofastidiosum methylothiophilum]|uniref:Ribonuclease HII n=1 Tax=Candidatus Methanofastidiosum methylothiophilum TaxID=1705564 RepID=A0A150J8F2_9EURY|nr:MAG: Ribonuclease HII [Candidatus Methanofastidiosum methylthiophilus]NMC77586.1 ribonuclease HII [Candidatus Methanofastidiosa archaeon]